MRKVYIIVLLLLAFRLQLVAKPVSLNVKKLLDSAKAIRTIVIIGYGDSSMYYRYLNSLDTFRTWCPKHHIIISGALNEILSEKWPLNGDTVLAIFNKYNDAISLFGKIEASYYRLWSPVGLLISQPNYVIEKTDYLLPLTNGCKESIDGKYWFCDDGCLVLKSYLKER